MSALLILSSSNASAKNVKLYTYAVVIVNPNFLIYNAKAVVNVANNLCELYYQVHRWPIMYVV